MGGSASESRLTTNGSDGRTAPVPVRSALVRVRDAQHGRFFERAAYDLKPDR